MLSENDKEGNSSLEDKTIEKNIVTDNIVPCTECPTHRDLITDLKKEIVELNGKYDKLQHRFITANNNSKILENRVQECKDYYDRLSGKLQFVNVSKVIHSIIHIHTSIKALEENIVQYKGVDVYVKSLLNSASTFNVLLSSAIERLKVKIIAPKTHDQFDARYHHIIEVVKAEDRDDINKIASIISIGYIFDDGKEGQLLVPANIIAYV